MKKTVFLLLIGLNTIYNSTAQKYLWGDKISPQSYNGDVYGIDVDQNNNSYLCGRYRDSIQFDINDPNSMIRGNGAEDGFVAKYDSIGNYQWCISIGNSYSEEIKAVKVDQNDNIYITGKFKGSVDFNPLGSPNVVSSTITAGFEMTDFYIAKYNANGFLQWVKSVGGPWSYTTSNDMTIDGNYIYVTGNYSANNVDFDPDSNSTFPVSNQGSADIFVAKYDLNGDFIWVSVAGGSQNEYGNTVDVDSEGNVVVGGDFKGTTNFSTTGTNNLVGTSTTPEMFVWKLDSTGMDLWAYQIDVFGSTSEIEAIEINNSNEIYVAGFYRDSAHFDQGQTSGSFQAQSSPDGSSDMMLIKISPSGEYMWGQTWRANGTDEIHDISLDSQENIMITGYFADQIDFDISADSNILISNTGGTLFIAKYKPNRDLIWAHGIYSSLSVASGDALYVDSNDDFYLGGIVSVSADLGLVDSDTVPVTLFGTDMFFAKYYRCADVTHTTNVNAICSYLLPDGSQLTSSGIWRDTLTSSLGCDSILLYNVTIDTITDFNLIATRDSFTCAGDSTTIQMANSQLNVSYYLRDDSDNSQIDGPINGSNSSIMFNTGVINQNTTYNVLASTSSGLAFNKIDGHVDASSNAWFPDDNSDDYTLECWAYIESFGGEQGLITYSWDVTPNEPFCFISVYGSNLTFKSRNNNANNTIVTLNAGGLTTKTWHHVAASKSGNVYSLYLDGALVSSSTANAVGSFSRNLLLIGAQNHGNTILNKLNGKIDEVRIWSYARSGAEIMNNKDIIIDGNESNLESYYRFDEGNGLNVIDLSNNNNDGVLINMDSSSSWTNGSDALGCSFEMSQKPTVNIETPGFYILEPVNQVVCENEDAIFTVETQGLIDTLIWQVSYDNGLNWVDVSIGGKYTGTSDSLYISNLDSIESGYLYRSVAIKCQNNVDISSSATLIVNSPITFNQNLTECNSAIINGNVYNISQIVIDTLLGQASNGCDSIVTTNLTINQPATFSQSVTECVSAIINGNTYTSSQNVVDTLVGQAANGCDSIVTTNLTIDQPTNSTHTVFGCGSYTWIDGVTYTTSNNTAKDTLTNAAGCDSIVSLDLTIGTFSVGNIDTTGCESIDLFGQTFTTSQTVNDTIIGGSSQGCDTITIANITVNQNTSATFNDSIIEGDIYNFFGTNINIAGTYDTIILNAAGCDSNITLNLTVIPDGGVGVSEEIDNLSIFPNPTNRVLNIKTDEIISEISIFDASGRNVLTKQINNTSSIIDISLIDRGIYFYELISDTGKTVRGKIVKE